MDRDSQARFFRHGPARGRSPQGPLAKLLAVLLGTIFLGLAMMFSLLVLAVVAIGGLAFWGWLRWKTRSLRKQMPPRPAGDPLVIEGEFVRHADAMPENPLP